MCHTLLIPVMMKTPGKVQKPEQGEAQEPEKGAVVPATVTVTALQRGRQEQRLLLRGLNPGPGLLLLRHPHTGAVATPVAFSACGPEAEVVVRAPPAWHGKVEVQVLKLSGRSQRAAVAGRGWLQLVQDPGLLQVELRAAWLTAEGTVQAQVQVMDAAGSPARGCDVCMWVLRGGGLENAAPRALRRAPQRLLADLRYGQKEEEEEVQETEQGLLNSHARGSPTDHLGQAEAEAEVPGGVQGGSPVRVVLMACGQGRAGLCTARVSAQRGLVLTEAPRPSFVRLGDKCNARTCTSTGHACLS